MAPDPGTSGSDSDSGDAGRRGRDSGATSDASATRDSGSRGGDSGTTEDGGTTHDAATDPPAPLMWGLDSTYLYSIDTDTGTIHRAANFTSCGSMNDLAIDAAGNLYGAIDYTATDDDGGSITYYTPALISINTATSTATCSLIDPSVQSEQPSLGFRAAGDMLGVSFIDSAYVAKVNPTTAATQANMFLLDSMSATGDDVACSTSGTCWASIGFGGASASIVSFSDTLTGASTPMSSPAVSCWGLGYAKHALFCFEGNGSIAKIDLESDPLTVTMIALHMDDASALPTYWSGAASQPD